MAKMSAYGELPKPQPPCGTEPTRFNAPDPQEFSVDKLSRQGWRVDTSDDDTVYLSKRNPKLRGQTLYCQVDADGEVR